MKEMKERLKLVRESLIDDKGKKYTQEKFANLMNVTRDMIATYESGRVIPSDLYINSLCDKFRINETWLRTGEGEMHEPATKSQETAQIIKKVMLEDNAIRFQLEKLVCKLTDEQLQHIYDMAKEFVEAVEEENLPK